MAEETFRAGHWRQTFSKNCFQSIAFGEVIVPGCSPVSIDIVDLLRSQAGAVQRALHGLGSTRTLRMRRGGVMRITACAPSCEPCENLRATPGGVLLGFEDDDRRSFAKTHARSTRIERTAPSRIHQ